MYNVMLEITQLTFALPTTVVCNQFMSTCKAISQKWRSPLHLFGQHTTPGYKVKVEVMCKLFHQHMPPDKVKVEVMYSTSYFISTCYLLKSKWKSWASWRWRVRAVAALAAEAAEGEEELNQGYHASWNASQDISHNCVVKSMVVLAFTCSPAAVIAEVRGGTQLRQNAPCSSSSQDWSMIGIFMCSFGFCFLFFSWSKKLQ
jgi:hypothetical protein